MAIVALGAGFFAGLRMTGPDMKMALDRHFDESHMYDVRIVGTMGLDESDRDALENLEGIQDVMMAYETDVLATLQQASYTMRLHSIPQAALGEVDDGGANLNQLELSGGRWPAAPGECVICTDRVTGAQAELGDEIVITQGTGDLSNTLAVRDLTVVGTVHAPYYVSTANLDSSSLGSGVVQQVVYVREDAFAESYPFTEAFVTVDGAAELSYDTEEYDNLIGAAVERIKGIADERCEARMDQVQDALVKNATTYDGLLSLAEYRLSHTQEEIDDPERPEWLVLTRDKNAGTASFSNDAERIDHIASVFPFIFFLVAALVALTTMTRMVDEERMLAGTYKALGYSRAKITSKYLIYATLASGVGAAVGIAVLSRLLPSVILNTYGIMYRVPARDFPLDVPIATISAALFMAITLTATWLSISATLRERPAALLLPKVVASGKRIALERIVPLWHSLSFTWKVTARNIFRYKKRFIMTVAGIAGCTALLLTGFGLRDAINDIIDVQYGELVHFNAIVSTNAKMGSNQRAELIAVLEDESLVDSYTAAYTETMLARGPRAENKRIDIVVPFDPETYGEFKTMRTRVGHVPVELGPQTVALNEKLSVELGVGVGDVIHMAKQDAMGNATSTEYNFVITDLVENYIYNYLYVGEDVYREVIGSSVNATSYYANVSGGHETRLLLDDKLSRIRGVRTLAFNDDTIDTYRRMLRSVDLIVVVLIVSAAALAFIVLYNLTNINIEERMREIATIKVLGFTRRETYAYIFREIAILAVVGCLVGLVLGVFLESFVVTTAEVDQVMFGRAVHPPSYLYAAILTLVFSALSMILMLPKLSRVDMVMSLKSNE